MTANALFASLLVLSTIQAQEVITPRFTPAPSTGITPAVYHGAPGQIVPVAAQRPLDGRGGEPGEEPYVRAELPGPQRQFVRDSEEQFFDRIRHERKKQGAGRADFPPQPVLTKEPYRPRNFARMTEVVEPIYVCHGRLYFEQPNFERAGYDFGVLQPAICLGVFYYDMALLPYHAWTDLRERSECNVGKCLPGDPAPFLVPRERFSVTGLLGQSATMIGWGFLLP